VYVQLRATGGSEKLRGRQVDANVSHIGKMRYTSDIEPTWRLKSGDTYLNIVAVYDVDGTNQYLEIQCRQARP